MIEVVQSSPDRLRHQSTGGVLQQRRNTGKGGQQHRKQTQRQQRQQPNPAGGTRHQRYRHQHHTPGIAGIGQIHRGHLSHHQPKHHQQTPGAPGHPFTPAPPATDQRRQQQGPAQRQPGGRDVGVIEQSGEPACGITAFLEMPDHGTTKDLPGALPTQPDLTQSGRHHGNRASCDGQTNPAPGRGVGNVGLKAPEPPEQGQPITQTHPSQEWRVAGELSPPQRDRHGTGHHQGRHQDEH